MTDVIILGGGVAALWTGCELKARGYTVAIISNSNLGVGQSLAAQGVIHGGLKYALGGVLNDASEALAAMPKRWEDAVNGKGLVDLSGAEVLSSHQIMWSSPTNPLSRAASLLGSKTLVGRAGAMKRDEWPAALSSPRYKGNVFRISEPVLCPHSIIRELARNLDGDIYAGDASVEMDGSGKVQCI
ncbi:MAG: FAD-dependent oxidoreductase, partial [Verrucomicrobiota bacterium]